MYVFAIVILLVLWNVFVFALYGIDKYKSKRQLWRIPEAALITLAFLFGCYGAWAAMVLFRHKTLHTKFRVLVPVAVIIDTAILATALYF